MKNSFLVGRLSNRHESEILILSLIMQNLPEACQSEGVWRGLRTHASVRANPQRTRAKQKIHLIAVL